MLQFTKEKVYVETSFFSFYHDDRTSPGVVAMRQWSREWWDIHGERYELVTSAAVLDELSIGELPHRTRAFEMAFALPIVTIGSEVEEIAELYIRHKVMPNNPGGDALHLALASFHKCDYLLTWNCKHIANAHKFAHIRRVNALIELSVPALVTPIQFLEGSLE